jgi:hypothetical protein
MQIELSKTSNPRRRRFALCLCRRRILVNAPHLWLDRDKLPSRFPTIAIVAQAAVLWLIA